MKTVKDSITDAVAAIGSGTIPDDIFGEDFLNQEVNPDDRRQRFLIFEGLCHEYFNVIRFSPTFKGKYMKTIDRLPNLNRKPALVIGGGSTAKRSQQALELARDSPEKITIITCDRMLEYVSEFVKPDYVVSYDSRHDMICDWLNSVDNSDLKLITTFRIHPHSIRNWKGEIYFLSTREPPSLASLIEKDFGLEPTHVTTTGMMAYRMAVEMNANPIALTGFDFCFDKKPTLAQHKNSYETRDIFANKVWRWLNMDGQRLDLIKEIQEAKTRKGIKTININNYFGMLYDPQLIIPMLPKEFMDYVNFNVDLVNAYIPTYDETIEDMLRVYKRMSFRSSPGLKGLLKVGSGDTITAEELGTLDLEKPNKMAEDQVKFWSEVRQAKKRKYESPYPLTRMRQSQTEQHFGKMWRDNFHSIKHMIPENKTVFELPKYNEQIYAKSPQLNKPGIIIGAGPSLKRVLPELTRFVKEVDCVTICVDRALPYIQEYFKPDYVVALDAREDCIGDWISVCDNSDMSLITTVYIHKNTLDAWKGKIYFSNPALPINLAELVEKDYDMKMIPTGSQCGVFSMIVGMQHMALNPLLLIGCDSAFDREKNDFGDNIGNQFIVKDILTGHNLYVTFNWLDATLEWFDYIRYFANYDPKEGGFTIINCASKGGSIIYDGQYIRPSSFQEMRMFFVLSRLSPMINDAELRGINTKKAEEYFDQTQDKMGEVRDTEAELKKKLVDEEIVEEDYRRERMEIRDKLIKEAEAMLEKCQEEVEKLKER